jgi:hypothetical protein
VHKIEFSTANEFKGIWRSLPESGKYFDLSWQKLHFRRKDNVNNS